MIKLTMALLAATATVHGQSGDGGDPQIETRAGKILMTADDVEFTTVDGVTESVSGIGTKFTAQIGENSRIQSALVAIRSDAVAAAAVAMNAREALFQRLEIDMNSRMTAFQGELDDFKMEAARNLSAVERTANAAAEAASSTQLAENNGACDADHAHTISHIGAGTDCYRTRLCDGVRWTTLVGAQPGEYTCLPIASCGAAVAARGEGMYWVGTAASNTQLYCMPDGSVAGDGSNARPGRGCQAILGKYPATRSGGRRAFKVLTRRGSTASISMKCNPTMDTRVFAARRGFTHWFRAEDFDHVDQVWKSVNPAALYSHQNNAGDMPTLTTEVMVAGTPLVVKVGPPSRGDNPSNDGTDTVSLLGDTQTHKLTFKGLIARTWSLCTTTRYTPGGSRGRIFSGLRTNWLHGHWGGRRQVAYYDGWMTYNSRGGTYDWVILCSKNGDTRRSYGNGGAYRGTMRNVNSNNQDVGIGTGRYSNERSKFAVHEVMAWNRALTNAEQVAMTAYLGARVAGRA